MRRSLRLLLIWLLAGAFMLLAACNDDPGGPPPPPVLERASGDGQSGVVGAVLSQPLSVRVRSADGRAMSGVAVSWSVTAGQGSIQPAGAVTDAEGRASANWTLGTTAGAQQASATIEGVEPATFSATANPDVPVQLTLARTQVTMDALGDTASLGAAVRDRFSNPIASAALVWSSTDTVVATVSPAGLVTSRKNGAATINVQADTLHAAAQVTVLQQSAAVVIMPDTVRFVAVSDTARLVAQARDRRGNVLAGAQFTWASLDTTIAVIDADGLARSKRNGTALLTAALVPGAQPTMELNMLALTGPALDSATVVVQQVATAVNVTPAAFSLQIGDTASVAATAADRNGFAVAGGSFTWSSSDAEVATVSPAGLVTARRAGSAEIRAAMGSLAGSAQLQVGLQKFEPTRDTTLAGNVFTESVEIPAGVTVTAGSDLVLDASTTANIAGTIQSDCRGITVRARGNVTVTGTVTSVCADTTKAAPPLRIIAGGDYTLDGATVTSGGAIEVTNDTTLPLPTRSPTTVQGTFAATGQASSAAGICTIRNSNVAGSPFGAPPGTPGGTVGGRGSDGAPVGAACAGTLQLFATTVSAQRGGNGGPAEGVTGTIQGGNGGAGGSVVLLATGDVLLYPGIGKETFIITGSGGAGGHALPPSGGRVRDATMIGGNGGPAGVPRITSTGGMIDIEFDALFQLNIEIGAGSQVGSLGGSAVAVVENGTDATAAVPAQPMSNVSVRGGDGGLVGFLPELRLLGDILSGNVTNPGEIRLVVRSSGTGGVGSIRDGRSGSGNGLFPDGAPFIGSPRPTLTARGGDGGDALVLDNRTNEYVGTPGMGGASIFENTGDGGLGFPDCVAGDLRPGGNGGIGAIIAGGGGAGGRLGNTGTRNSPGPTDVFETARGANGADGVNPGTPGTGGVEQLTAPTPPNIDITSFRTGTAGLPCLVTHDANIVSISDPGGHFNFTRFHTVTQITSRLSPVALQGPGTDASHARADTYVELTGPQPWITLRGGPIAADGSVTLSGSGTVAGFPNVSVQLVGKLLLDASGRVSGVEGDLTVGGGGELPGGQPIIYRLTATRRP
jgi:hypothetical protein